MKKNYFFRTAILLVTLLFGAVPSFGAVDILQNGSFEDWSGETPTAWNGTTTNISASGVAKSSDARTGSNALALTVTSDKHKRYTTQTYRLTPGVEYAFSYWVKGEGEVRNANVLGQTYSTYTDYNKINSTEWSQITYSFNVTAEGDYEIIFSVRNTASTGLIIDDVELIDPSSETVLADPQLAFTDITGDINKTLTDGSYSSAATTVSDASIVYSSSNTEVATIDQAGLVTLVTGGTTVIKAEVAETESYYSGAVQYTLTVIDLSKAKTFAKVTDGTVTDGKYIIVYQESDEATSVMAMNTTNTENYFEYSEIDLTEGKIVTDDQSIIWDITTESDGNYSISNDGIYVAYNGSTSTKGGNNAYADSEYATERAGWKIEYDAAQDVFLFKNAEVEARILQFNTNANQGRFACYRSEQGKITLYKLDEGPATGIENVEVANMKIINGKGQVTIETTEAARVAVYALTGAQVRQLDLVEGTNIVELPAGIYVIGRQKVIVF